MADRVAALGAAKARLDRLDYYPTPVSIRHTHVFVVPALFKLPWFRRFDGYAAHHTIFLRDEPETDADRNLLTHELCHVWQMQHHPIAMPLSYLRTGYASNPYEAEARRSVAETS